MARRKSRWSEQRSGKRTGALHRATGTPSGRPVPARLMRKAKKGAYGRATQRRAKAARGSGR